MEFEILLDKYLTYINFQGFVIVTRKNKIILYKKYGKCIIDTLSYPLASLSKQFTAAAIYELISKNSITLDTRISDIYGTGYTTKDVTIRNLLTMSSGIVDYLNDLSYIDKLEKIVDIYDHVNIKENIIKVILNNQLKFRPDSKIEYSNSNYYLIGDIIEKTTDMSFESYLRETIFKDYELSDTFFAMDMKGREIFFI